MSEDITSLENELRGLRPAALDDALIERLERCATGEWQLAGTGELEFGHRLRSQAPAPLGEALAARMLASVGDLPFPSGPPKILPFPATITQAPQQAKFQRHWLAAAAAVALLGALAAWLVPHSPRAAAPVAAGERSVPAPPSSITPPHQLVPAGLHRGLSEASDEGVVFNENRRPHKVLKFVYRDRVTLKDADGRTYEVEQPRVEYLIVPAKTD